MTTSTPTDRRLLFSRVTDHGTAMQEATLCSAHFHEPYIGYANVWADGADDVGPQDWVLSTQNDSISCVECGYHAVPLQDGECSHSASHAVEYNPATDWVTWECNGCGSLWGDTPTEDDRNFEPLISGGCAGCQ